MSAPDGKLHKVLRLKAQKERRALNRLAQARGELEQAQAQAQELEQLLAEYRTGFANVGTKLQLMGFAGFYQRLWEAHAAQAVVVANARTACDQAQIQYLSIYRERRGLEQLLAKREAEHRVVQNRQGRRATPVRPQRFV